METTYGTLPPYAPAAEIYRSSRRNLAMAMLLFFGTLAAIAVATVPALDVGGVGFGPWDALLVLAIATFFASLLAIMLMYVNDEHQPRLLMKLTITMHLAALCYGLLQFTGSPDEDSYPQQAGRFDTIGQAVLPAVISDR